MVFKLSELYGAEMTRPLEERFHEKYEIVEPGGCWVWMAGTSSTGYGLVHTGSRMERAHRMSWELHNGPIPEGKGYHGTCVLHRCDVPSCVNPNHLFLGSQAENMADMNAKGRVSRGEAHGHAKLTETDVLDIRKLAGAATQQQSAGRIYKPAQRRQPCPYTP